MLPNKIKKMSYQQRVNKSQISTLRSVSKSKYLTTPPKPFKKLPNKLIAVNLNPSLQQSLNITWSPPRMQSFLRPISQPAGRVLTKTKEFDESICMKKMEIDTPRSMMSSFSSRYSSYKKYGVN